MDSHSFVAGLAPETRKRTNLDSLKPGSSVNLERSVTPNTRMGGHFVQGHVDATGAIQAFRKDQDALWVTIEVPESLMRYIVVKGYVTIDGTSLTVVDVGGNWFSVTLVLGKYVERLLQFNTVNQDPVQVSRQPVTAQFLKENGYE
jgi:riboflavin synthase